MSECTGLSKFKPYDLGWIKHDEAQGAYIMQIVNPPATCADGIYITHKGELKVVREASNAQLLYTDHPVITVRDEALVTVINPSTNYFGYVLGFAALCLATYFVYRLFARQQQPAYVGNSDGGFTPRQSYSGGYAAGTRMAPVGGGTTIVNNNGGGGNDLLTGVLVGEMLAGGSHGGNNTTIIKEKETIIKEPAAAPAKDDSSFGSDSGSSSFGSDSSSSFGSDSSSSFGSDSSSSFGSDSGSSFGSDSGSSGGSFGND